MSRSSPDGTARRNAFLLAALALTSVLAASPPVQADHGAGETRWLVETHVEADVHHNYAQVDVTAVIENRDVDPEFPFRVRLPEDALVTGLTITRDGQTYEADVKPTQEARDEYEEHKSKKETAGLVEQAGSGNVYEFLVNVEGTERVEATLTYEVYLQADRGQYSLPLEAPATPTGHDQGATFDVRVTHPAGVQSVSTSPAADVRETDEGWTVTRDVGPRGDETRATPLAVNYTLAPTSDSGSVAAAVSGGQGYFAHWVRAQPQDGDLPLDVVLALDTSGSMSGPKIEQLRSAAKQLVSRLDGSDRLQVVPFSSEARPTWEGLQAADEGTRQEAYGALEDLAATGSTNIEGALRTSISDLEEAPDRDGQAVQAVVLLSDGKPTAGAESAPELREIVREEAGDDLSLFGLAFGDDADWSLTYGLAQETDGYAERVAADADAEVDLRRFFSTLATPVLRDVSVTYDGNVTSHRIGSPVLFRGSEVLVVGRFDPAMDRLEGQVTGAGVNGSYQASFSQPVDDGSAAGADFLPRLVAYQRIRTLQAQIDAVGEQQGLVEKVQGLALEHGFVTDYTSLVVTLPSQDEPRRMQPTPEDPGERGFESGTPDAGAGVPLLPVAAPVAMAAVLAGAAALLGRPRRPGDG